MSGPDRGDSRSQRRTGPARHELPVIDERGLIAARAADVVIRLAADRGQERWVTFFAPLPDHFRDGSLAEMRAAAMRGRAAFGPKDSIRDVLPAEATEPLLDAVDRLLRELNRHDRMSR